MMPSLSRSDRSAQFPARPRRAGRSRYQPDGLGLEPRILLTADPYAPTADEQYMLELINQARANPAAEGQRLIAEIQTNPVLQAETAGWNLNQFLQVISSITPAPPLAFDPRLIEAAINEDSAMLAQNNQVHSPPGYLTNPSVAVASDGQPYFSPNGGSWATGENIFAYSAPVNSPSMQAYDDFFNAAFLLDWGNPDFGHLDNVLAPGPGEVSTDPAGPFNVIGIGLMPGAFPTTPAPIGAGQNVGPVLVTEEFAGSSTMPAILTGVAYNDANSDNFYEPGEGLGGVLIQAVGLQGQGTYQVTTWASGGYSLPLPPGTYQVTAYGNGMPGFLDQSQVTIGSSNVEWDIRTDEPLPTADAPVPANYDFTGRTDVAVYRPSTSQWFIAAATGGVSAQFGGPGDIPVPADYDGVGHAEIAVFRPSTGQWFIVGLQGGRVVAFGGPGDIPVPGNYDGVGHAEPAVFRPSTGQWFILGPRGGRVVAFGGPGDIPVPGNYDGVGPKAAGSSPSARPSSTCRCPVITTATAGRKWPCFAPRPGSGSSPAPRPRSSCLVVRAISRCRATTTALAGPSPRCSGPRRPSGSSSVPTAAGRSPSAPTG
jgi:hypothetical protein